MQRDLAIDPAQLLSEKPELSPLPEPNGIGQSRPAAEIDVITVMAGGMPAARPEGQVSGLIMPCVIPDCGPAMRTTGPLPAPVRGTPMEDLFEMAQRGARCNCGGGGGCSNHCPDPDACTNSYCENNSCVNVAIHCTDYRLCTDDSCDPGRTPPCDFVERVCEPVNPCTPPLCYESTGLCRTESMCSGPCCEGDGEPWCCSAGKTCCEYNYDPPNNFGCCPPEKPFCCNSGPQQMHCCASQAQCCGTGCCQLNQACCNGVCGTKGACCFFDTGSCSEMTSLCCGQQGGSFRGDGTTCTPSDLCMPRCDNCHEITATYFECGHATDDPAEPCAPDWCIEDMLASATCDKHPHRVGAAQCNTDLAFVGALVYQQRYDTTQNPCIPQDTSPLHVWIMAHRGCAYDECVNSPVNVRCDTFGCGGVPLGNPAPRGVRRVCGCD